MFVFFPQLSFYCLTSYSQFRGKTRHDAKFLLISMYGYAISNWLPIPMKKLTSYQTMIRFCSIICFLFVDVDRQFPGSADRRQRLPQSWPEIGHGAGGQTHPAAQQNLPADPHRQGGHQGQSSWNRKTVYIQYYTLKLEGKKVQHKQKYSRKVQIP